MATTEFDIAWEHFGREGWPRVLAQPGRVIQTVYSGGGVQINGYLHVLADTRQLVYYSVHSRHAPKAVIPALLEFAARANWDRRDGVLEVHADHGGIRMRTSLTLGEATLDDALLRPLTLGNATMMFRLQPGLDKLIDGAPVADALAACT